VIETVWNDLDREQKKQYEKSKPLCFSSGKQYWLWREAARFSQPEPHHEWCEDCMLEYQTKMINEGRCKFPGTIFVSAGSNQHSKKSTDGGTVYSNPGPDRAVWWAKMETISTPSSKKATEGGTVYSNPGLGLDVEGKRPFWYIKQRKKDMV